MPRQKYRANNKAKCYNNHVSSGFIQKCFLTHISHQSVIKQNKLSFNVKQGMSPLLFCDLRFSICIVGVISMLPQSCV